MKIVNLIHVELIKIKRTLLFYLCVGSPLLITILMFLIFTQNGEELITNYANGKNWLFLSKLVQTYWGLFFLPLFVTLQTALLAGLEHQGKMWKMIFTQPVRRLDVLGIKYFMNFVVIGISQILLFPLTILLGFLLQKLNPALGFSENIPYAEIFKLVLTVYGLSLLIIAIHAWVALRWKNFVMAMSVGIGATVSGVLVVNSEIAPYYPWAMSGLIANHFFEKSFPWTTLFYSLGLGTLVILLGLLNLLSRETY